MYATAVGDTTKAFFFPGRSQAVLMQRSERLRLERVLMQFLLDRWLAKR